MIKTGINLYPLIAVRSNPTERAELVTQLLFGETYVIEEIFGNWIRMVSLMDHYEGWIDKKLSCLLTDDELNTISAKPFIKTTIPLTSLHVINKSFEQPLVAGSLLPINKNKYSFTFADKYFEYQGQYPKNIPANGESIIEIATQFIGAPYLWGGKTILGMDCSGFVQLVYGIIGIQLPRDASKQITLGKTLSFLDEAKPGDLAFFDNENGDIVHVGLLVDNSHILHASGAVRIDAIDHQGIYNAETNRYSHKLRIVKQIIE